MMEAHNIPAIIDRASSRLLEARSSAEVLEAKAIAEAALHYSRVTKAANETHADCLRIITRAEMRMANEIDRGQASGVIQRHGDVQGSDIAKFDDLGIDRRRVSEWRELRDAGEQEVEGAIQLALSEGRAPTKADIRNHVRGTFGTGDNEWYTPKEHLEAARSVLGTFSLDPASSEQAQREVNAAAFYTKEDDGLAKEWHGTVWLNPPYAQPHIANFVSKMVREYGAGRVTAGIMLTHNYTDTTWFHEAIGQASAVCFTRGRVKFYGPDGSVAAPTQGQAFFYFGEDITAFRREFAQFGFVVAPCR